MSTSRPLRVLILTYIYTDFDPRYGGEGRVVWETTQALARQGVEVFVVTSMKNLSIPPHPNIRLYKIPFAKKNFLNFNPGELLKIFLFSIPLLYIKKIDIIHQLPTDGPNPFAYFKFGRIFAESADPAWDYENPKFGKELQLDRAKKSKRRGSPRPDIRLIYGPGLPADGLDFLELTRNTQKGQIYFFIGPEVFTPYSKHCDRRVNWYMLPMAWT